MTLLAVPSLLVQRDQPHIREALVRYFLPHWQKLRNSCLLKCSEVKQAAFDAPQSHIVGKKLWKRAIGAS